MEPFEQSGDHKQKHDTWWLAISMLIYEVLVVTLLFRELVSSRLRATDVSLILLGLMFLPVMVALFSRALKDKGRFDFKVGDIEVHFEDLKKEVLETRKEIDEKTKELAEQIEGKLSTAEQTLYPLVGGRNAFSEKRLKQNRLIIGSKDFAANIVVAEFMAQHLENNGIRCERRIPNGGTITNYAALSNGWIDLFIDYTGTGCMLFNIDFRETTEPDIHKTLNNLCSERFGFEWMDSFGTRTNYCLLMEKEFAEKQKIRSISDINKHGFGKLRFCSNYEFMHRLDGFVGLQHYYGLRFKQEDIVSYADRYNNLVNGSADVSVGHTTDPAINALKLTVLEDDQRFFPEYFETPLVRSEALANIDGLRDIINNVSRYKLTNENITALIHDYNTNIDSLSGSVKSMLERKFSWA